MKLKISVLAAIVATSCAFNASAQTTKVAYVDIDRVIEGSEKITAAMNTVKSDIEDLQKEIEEKRARLVAVKDEIKKGQGVIAESELKKKRSEESSLEKELVDLEYQGRREMQKLDTVLFEPTMKSIVLAIQDVAKERDIDLILRGEAVLYGAETADVTEAVVKKINSASYNLAVPNDSDTSNDKESTKPSSENSEPNETSAKKSEEPAAEKTREASADGEEKKPIFPKIPLVTRPVDRQSD